MSDDSSQLIALFHNSGAVGLILYMMVVLVAALIFVGFFFLIQRLCAKWESIRRPEQAAAAAAATNPQRRSFHFPQQSPTHHGLDPSVLKSLPVVAFSSKEEFKEVLECAVCLSEIETGEKARLLPKCYHGFHLDCIDMWFQSHSTCPVCRNPVSTQLRKPGITPFWENLNQVSDLESGLVLEEEEEDGHDRNLNELPSSSSSSAPLS